jgi:hypothetical protein
VRTARTRDASQERLGPVDEELAAGRWRDLLAEKRARCPGAGLT